MKITESNTSCEHPIKILSELCRSETTEPKPKTSRFMIFLEGAERIAIDVSENHDNELISSLNRVDTQSFMLVICINAIARSTVCFLNDIVLQYFTCVVIIMIV